MFLPILYIYFILQARLLLVAHVCRPDLSSNPAHKRVSKIHISIWVSSFLLLLWCCQYFLEILLALYLPLSLNILSSTLCIIYLCPSGCQINPFFFTNPSKQFHILRDFYCSKHPADPDGVASYYGSLPSISKEWLKKSLGKNSPKFNNVLENLMKTRNRTDRIEGL